MAFLGVEGDDVFDHAAFFQDDGDVLGAHARLGKRGEPAGK